MKKILTLALVAVSTVALFGGITEAANDTAFTFKMNLAKEEPVQPKTNKYQYCLRKDSDPRTKCTNNSEFFSHVGINQQFKLNEKSFDYDLVIKQVSTNPKGGNQDILLCSSDRTGFNNLSLILKGNTSVNYPNLGSAFTNIPTSDCINATDVKIPTVKNEKVTVKVTLTQNSLLGASSTDTNASLVFKVVE